MTTELNLTERETVLILQKILKNTLAGKIVMERKMVDGKDVLEFEVEGDYRIRIHDFGVQFDVT